MTYSSSKDRHEGAACGARLRSCKSSIRRIALRFGGNAVPGETSDCGAKPVLSLLAGSSRRRGGVPRGGLRGTGWSAGNDFELRIIGDGPLNAELRRFVCNYQLQSHVKFLGFLNHSQYLQEMRAADIFVHPSVIAADGDSEGGAPTTILEAQAYGLPIIASTHA